jgi:hypothetical protein
MDPLNAERITLNKQTFPLAADFDAPTALLIARERPERLGLSRVMNPKPMQIQPCLPGCSNSIPRGPP